MTLTNYKTEWRNDGAEIPHQLLTLIKPPAPASSGKQLESGTTSLPPNFIFPAKFITAKGTKILRQSSTKKDSSGFGILETVSVLPVNSTVSVIKEGYVAHEGIGHPVLYLSNDTFVMPSDMHQGTDVAKKYEVQKDIIQDNPFANLTIYCIVAPCPQPEKTITVFKKGDIVMGVEIPIMPNEKRAPQIKAWKENSPNNIFTINLSDLKPISDTPLSSITSGISTLVPSKKTEWVVGIALFVLVFAVLKWQKII